MVETLVFRNSPWQIYGRKVAQAYLLAVKLPILAIGRLLGGCSIAVRMAIAPTVAVTIAAIVAMPAASHVAIAAIRAIGMDVIHSVAVLAGLHALARSDGLLCIGCAVAFSKDSEGVQDWPVACAAAVWQARNITVSDLMHCNSTDSVHIEHSDL